MTRPGYLVPSAEEGDIHYSPTSPYADDDHSTRVALRERLTARSGAPEPAPAAAAEAGGNN
jgi:hypothetical protein